MEVLQRLQPVDIFFAILWACIVGWGLSTGVVRQLGMLVAVYAAALLSSSGYQIAGQALGLAFGGGNQPLLEFVAYVGLFVIVSVAIGFIFWRAYPGTRLSRKFGWDNALGAIVAAVWGVLLLIELLTILRYYALVPLSEQEATRAGVLRQVQLSQVAPVLEVVAAPLWEIMVPWFPKGVSPRI
ncbi:MAG: CvpA family protein [Chloroflexi bacterium]|nr:CvpA family protein [Chloroflexota bacterium]